MQDEFDDGKVINIHHGRINQWFGKMLECVECLPPEERAEFDRWDGERPEGVATSDWPGLLSTCQPALGIRFTKQIGLCRRLQLRSLRKTTLVLITPCLFTFASMLSAQTFPNAGHDQVILTAFRQAYKGENDGEAHGNCASVAVIKAAMATFGEDAIFTSGYPAVDWTTTTVIFRNGEQIDLLRSEADQAAKRSGFKLVGNQAILDKANFAFAVMAKRAVALHLSSLTFPDQSTYASEFGSATDLDKAYSFLNGPQTGSHLPVLLGLASGPAKRKKQLAYVYGNSYHAAFASMAQYDAGGTSHSIPAFLWGHVTLNLGADLANDDFSVRDAAPTQVAR